MLLKTPIKTGVGTAQIQPGPIRRRFSHRRLNDVLVWLGQRGMTFRVPTGWWWARNLLRPIAEVSPYRPTVTTGYGDPRLIFVPTYAGRSRQ
jgi:hypothetical protein